jgi:hypothetical protein
MAQLQYAAVLHEMFFTRGAGALFRAGGVPRRAAQDLT